MSRSWLAGLAVALVACKTRRDPPAPPEPIAAAEGSAVAADAALLIDARPSAAHALPAVIGPPAPFDRLRPSMKEADAEAVLADAGARRLTRDPDTRGSRIPPGARLYETALPDTSGYATYHGGRLWSVTIVSEIEDALVAPVFARWGQGSVDANAPFKSLYTEYRWPTSPSGWQAALRVPPKDAYRIYTDIELELTHVESAESPAVVTVSAQFLPQVARLIGAPLDAAERMFGKGLHRETADDDDAAAERGAARQGFATIKTPWMESTWQLVLHTSAGTGRIETVELRGATQDDAGRIALFAALRSAFGAPRAVVSPAGRIEIEIAGAAGVVRCIERDDAWTITIRRAGS